MRTHVIINVIIAFIDLIIRIVRNQPLSIECNVKKYKTRMILKFNFIIYELHPYFFRNQVSVFHKTYILLLKTSYIIFHKP